MCIKCGSPAMFPDCGCYPSPLTTIPYIPGPLCVNPNPCSQIFSTDCVIYTGIPFPGCSINTNMTMTTVVNNIMTCIAGILPVTADWLTSGNSLTGSTPTTPIQYIGSNNDYDFLFKTNSIERMRLAATGALLIGVTVPTSSTVSLQVNSVLVYTTGAINTPAINTTPGGTVIGDWWFQDIAGVTYFTRMNSLGVIQQVQLT